MNLAKEPLLFLRINPQSKAEFKNTLSLLENVFFIGLNWNTLSAIYKIATDFKLLIKYSF